MKLKTYLFAILIALTSAGTMVSADKLSLNTLSSYLNSLKSVDAQFTQINGDGTLSTGRIFIKRPGRIRFEYDPPNDALVLASAGQLAIFDPKGDGGPETYPLSKTPLSLILAENINLTRARMVLGHSYDGKATSLLVQDPEFPERGRINLVFTGPKAALRQWIIEDDSGSVTTVILNDVKTGMELGDSKFNIMLNAQKRKK
jgi:outer membrane lipoprotein-sorting protein